MKKASFALAALAALVALQGAAAKKNFMTGLPKGALAYGYTNEVTLLEGATGFYVEARFPASALRKSLRGKSPRAQWRLTCLRRLPTPSGRCETPTHGARNRFGRQCAGRRTSRWPRNCAVRACLGPRCGIRSVCGRCRRLRSRRLWPAIVSLSLSCRYPYPGFSERQRTTLVKVVRRGGQVPSVRP